MTKTQARREEGSGPSEARRAEQSALGIKGSGAMVFDLCSVPGPVQFLDPTSFLQKRHPVMTTLKFWLNVCKRALLLQYFLKCLSPNPLGCVRPVPQGRWRECSPRLDLQILSNKQRNIVTPQKTTFPKREHLEYTTQSAVSLADKCEGQAGRSWVKQLETWS